MRPKPVTVGGITFASVKLAAKHFGIAYGNAIRRISAGWQLEEAFGIEPRERTSKILGTQLVTKEGTFSSIMSAAKHFGIKTGTLQRRLALGWTADQAVGIENHKRQPSRSKINCDGKSYPNSWALARAFGKGEKLVAKRIKNGWTPEQAVEIEAPPPRFRDRPTTSGKHWRKIERLDERLYPATDEGQYKLYAIINKLSGKQYVGITISPLWLRFNGHKSAAKKNTNTKLYNAMRLHGLENFRIELIRSDAKSFVELQQQEIDEIAKRNTIDNGYNVSLGGSIGVPDPITVGGITFPAKSSAAEFFGVDVAVFNLRIGRLKWTPEQAAEIEPRPKAYRAMIVVGGKEFPSINQAAKHYGLSYRTTWSRIKVHGWSIDQAFGIAPPPDSIKFQGLQVNAFGMTFPTMKACAKHFGISNVGLCRKVRSGQSVEKAIATTLFNKKKYGKT